MDGQNIEGTVRILYNVHQIHDGYIYVAMRLFGEKASRAHQTDETELLIYFT